MTGEPHTALIALRQRQLLARHGRGEAGPQDLGRPGFAFWGRRARAEAEVGEARTAALQADVQLAEAVAAGEAAQARVAQAVRAADERVAAARQERDAAVSARDQAELRAALEAQITTLQDAQAGLQTRADHAEAEPQSAPADPGKAPGRGAQDNTHASHAAPGALREGDRLLNLVWTEDE